MCYNNSARASRFWYISLQPLDNYGVNFQISGKHNNTRRGFSFFFFLNVDTFLYNSNPGKIANFCRSERGGITAMKFKTVQVHFSSDVLSPPPPPSPSPSRSKLVP